MDFKDSPISPSTVVKCELLEDEDDSEESEIPLFPESLIRENISVSTITKNDVTSLPAAKPIQLGQTFKSFTDVALAVRLYENKNKVNLTQKYFRRIAANPKPSNKEDFSLSVEERKRFVHRWVDFCCTYFDTLMARSELDDEESGPAMGFTIKECPMRIRFQMRFKEKDLIVSIFRETHDHVHPNKPDSFQMPNKSSSGTSLGAPTTTTQAPKQNLRPPPSLAPLPNHQVARSNAKCLSPPSPLSIRRRSPGHLSPSLKLPRPPPLKKGPSAGGLGGRLSESVSTTQGSHGQYKPPCADAGIVQVSTKDIICNIFSYLIRIKTSHNRTKNEIVFKSQNPDLIKLTSEMTGIEEETVRQVISGRPNSMKTSIPKNAERSIRKTEVPLRKNANYAGIVRTLALSPNMLDRGAGQTAERFSASLKPKRRRPDFSENNSSGGWTSHVHVNSESSAVYEKLANLPLDISVKPELAPNNDVSEDENYATEMVDGRYNDHEELFDGGMNGR